MNVDHTLAILEAECRRLEQEKRLLEKDVQEANAKAAAIRARIGIIDTQYKEIVNVIPKLRS